MSNLILSAIFQTIALLFWVYFLFALLAGGGDNLEFVSVVFLIASILQFLALWLKRKNSTVLVEGSEIGQPLLKKDSSYLLILVIIGIVIFVSFFFFFLFNLHD